MGRKTRGEVRVETSLAERIVAEAVAELNLQRSAEDQIGKDPHALLFGPGGSLDSLGLVQLIAGVENGVEDASGQRVNLADEALLESAENPFRSIASLCAYLEQLA